MPNFAIFRNPGPLHRRSWSITTTASTSLHTAARQSLMHVNLTNWFIFHRERMLLCFYWRAISLRRSFAMYLSTIAIFIEKTSRFGHLWMWKRINIWIISNGISCFIFCLPFKRETHSKRLLFSLWTNLILWFILKVYRWILLPKRSKQILCLRPTSPSIPFSILYWRRTFRKKRVNLLKCLPLLFLLLLLKTHSLLCRTSPWRPSLMSLKQ